MAPFTHWWISMLCIHNEAFYTQLTEHTICRTQIFRTDVKASPTVTAYISCWPGELREWADSSQPFTITISWIRNIKCKTILRSQINLCFFPCAWAAFSLCRLQLPWSSPFCLHKVDKKQEGTCRMTVILTILASVIRSFGAKGQGIC